MTRQPLRAAGNVRLSTLLVILSSLLFATGGAAAKYLSLDVAPTSAVLWRNLLSAVAVLAYFAVRSAPPLNVERRDLHIVRGLVTFAGLWTYFVAITMVPLGTAVLLRTAAPVFVPLVAYLLYRRHSDRNVWIGAWVGLVGVALVVDPSWSGTGWGTALAVVSGILGAVGAVLIWRLGGLDSPATQMLWLMIVLALCSLMIAPWFLTWPRVEDWGPLIVIAATTTGSQVILTHAFQIAPADKVITWGYLSVAFGLLFGFLVWGEVPSIPAIAGVTAVIAGSIIATIKPIRRTVPV